MLTRMDTRAVGQLIKSHREARGWTLQEAHRRSRLSPNYWRTVEQGYKEVRGLRTEVTPSPGTILLMSNVLNLTPEEQDELFELTGYQFLRAKPPALAETLRPGKVARVAAGLSDEQIREIEDELSSVRLARRRKRKRPAANGAAAGGAGTGAGTGTLDPEAGADSGEAPEES